MEWNNNPVDLCVPTQETSAVPHSDMARWSGECVKGGVYGGLFYCRRKRGGSFWTPWLPCPGSMGPTRWAAAAAAGGESGMNVWGAAPLLRLGHCNTKLLVMEPLYWPTWHATPLHNMAPASQLLGNHVPIVCSPRVNNKVLTYSLAMVNPFALQLLCLPFLLSPSLQ